MEQVIIEILAVLIAAAWLVTELAVRNTQKMQKGLLFDHNRKVMLGLDLKNYDLREDLYVPKSFLKMHNGGVLPTDDSRKIEFKAIGTKEDYYM